MIYSGPLKEWWAADNKEGISDKYQKKKKKKPLLWACGKFIATGSQKMKYSWTLEQSLKGHESLWDIKARARPELLSSDQN